MKEFAKLFLNKDCVVTTRAGQFTGRLVQIGEDAILLEDDQGLYQAINLRHVTRLREHPLDKKGRKKTVIVN